MFLFLSTTVCCILYCEEVLENSLRLHNFKRKLQLVLVLDTTQPELSRAGSKMGNNRRQRLGVSLLYVRQYFVLLFVCFIEFMLGLSALIQYFTDYKYFLIRRDILQVEVKYAYSYKPNYAYFYHIVWEKVRLDDILSRTPTKWAVGSLVLSHSPTSPYYHWQAGQA